MANHYSALKRARQIERKTIVNRARKTRLRHTIRRLRRAMQASDLPTVKQLIPETFSIIDRAAKWGIIKSNTAARYKSRIHGRVRDLSAA
jgi:small subunit ribosomal protein S20